jgi:hypothetical protein
MAKVKPLHPHKTSEGQEKSPKPRKLTTTRHTVKLPNGSGYRVAVEHDDYEAVQYDFYIPRLIWDLPSVRTFIKRLDSVVFGATIFPELTGVWEGEREGTNIYRKIVPRSQFQSSNTRAALHSEIGRLMANLSASREFAQQAVMFTETSISVSMGQSLYLVD